MAPSTCRPMLTRCGPTICFHCLSAETAGRDKHGTPDAEPVLVRSNPAEQGPEIRGWLGRDSDLICAESRIITKWKSASIPPEPMPARGWLYSPGERAVLTTG